MKKQNQQNQQEKLDLEKLSPPLSWPWEIVSHPRRRGGDAGGGVVVPSGIGAFNDNDIAEAEDFDVFLGRHLKLDLVTLNDSSWASFAIAFGELPAVWSSREVLWDVPLCCNIGDLQGVADGDFDATFTACAEAIVRPFGRHLIRLGADFNLLSSHSRAFDGSGNPTAAVWVAAFKRVVGLFRAVGGPTAFAFVWAPRAGVAIANGLDATLCFPGPSFADVCGVNVFETLAAGVGDGSADFTAIKVASLGLDWVRSFAGAQGCLWALPAWGVGSDNFFAFMTSLCSYIVQFSPWFQVYWNSGEDQLIT